VELGTNPPGVPEFLAMVSYATYDSSCCPQYLGEAERLDIKAERLGGRNKYPFFLVLYMT